MLMSIAMDMLMTMTMAIFVIVGGGNVALFYRKRF